MYIPVTHIGNISVLSVCDISEFLFYLLNVYNMEMLVNMKYRCSIYIWSIYLYSDQVKEDEMGRPCSTNGGEEECI
jgi:hypothetical protein